MSTKKNPEIDGFDCDSKELESIPNNPINNTNNLEKLSQYQYCIGKRGGGLYICSRTTPVPGERRLNNIIKNGCLLNRHWNYSIVCYTLLGFFWLVLTLAWIMLLLLNISDKEITVIPPTSTPRGGKTSNDTGGTEIVVPTTVDEYSDFNDKIDPLKMTNKL